MEDFDKDPNMFPNPYYQKSFYKRILLDPERIQKQISELKDKLIEFEEQLKPGSRNQKYLGKAFIILEKASMTKIITSKYQRKGCKKYFYYLKKIFCSFKQDNETLHPFFLKIYDF